MSNIYAQQNIENQNSIPIIFPFSIEIDPMERLLLLNFEQDPDAVYIGFEPQVFNDSINGEGHMIIGWRRDKKVDIYHQPSLKLDPAKYSITGEGLNEMVSTNMDEAFYEVTDKGVQANYKFKDKKGRAIEIAISENSSRKRKPFGILAPMGDAASNPTSMPLVLLHDFYFVRKNNTSVLIAIDGKEHQLDGLPMPIDWQKMTFARYSSKPLIATLNPDFNGALTGFNVSKGQSKIGIENKTFELEWINSKPHIKSMTVANTIHPLSIAFTPSIPSINFLEGSSVKGQFKIDGHESVGSISGEYTIQQVNSSYNIVLIPSNGWRPKTTKFSTWFLFTMAKVFKKWPTTYKWEASVFRNNKDDWEIKAKWIRTGRILKD